MGSKFKIRSSKIKKIRIAMIIIWILAGFVLFIIGFTNEDIQPIMKKAFIVYSLSILAGTIFIQFLEFLAQLNK